MHSILWGTGARYQRSTRVAGVESIETGTAGIRCSACVLLSVGPSYQCLRILELSYISVPKFIRPLGRETVQQPMFNSTSLH